MGRGKETGSKTPCCSAPVGGFVLSAETIARVCGGLLRALAPPLARLARAAPACGRLSLPCRLALPLAVSCQVCCAVRSTRPSFRCRYQKSRQRLSPCRPFLMPKPTNIKQAVLPALQ